MTRTRRTSSEFPAALFGPVVWAAHFLAVYAVEGALCVISSPAAVRATGIALTVLAGAALLVFLYRSRRRAPAADSPTSDKSDYTGIAAPLAVLSLLAVAWTGLAVLTLPACASPGG